VSSEPPIDRGNASAPMDPIDPPSSTEIRGPRGLSTPNPVDHLRVSQQNSGFGDEINPKTSPVGALSPDPTGLSTTNGGQLDDCDPDHVDDQNIDDLSDPGLSALAAARAIASGKARTQLRRRRPRAETEATYSGARADRRDPSAIGSIVRNAISELGWETPLAQARLMGQWESLVGPEIAAHCRPVSLSEGNLKITAESTAWATQLRLLAPRILAKLCEQLPPGMVRRLVISGPSGPSWKKGPWSVPGGRGPRDTYG